jgi:choline transport protein
MPIFEIWRQATRSDVAATIFLVLLLLAALFALNATHQTASRLTWSFARDDALYGSRWLGNINSKQQVPIAALLFNFTIMLIIGCIYLGSTSAFNAFIGTGLILQHVIYAFPTALLMMRERSGRWLPKSRSFRLPSVVGWAANLATVAFSILVLVFYNFPAVLPVTTTSMSKFPSEQLCLRLLTIFRLRGGSNRCDGTVHTLELGWTRAEAFSWPALANAS